MANHPLKEKNLRKLTRMGAGSLGLTLPRELVSELKWKEKQLVTVKRQGARLVIHDWKKKKPKKQ